MLNSNTYLLIFAVAFMGCVLVTPMVTRIATWLGAIDRPDQFRRIHKGATPRMGGLGLAFGLAVGVAVAAVGGYLHDWSDYPRWVATLLPIGLAGADRPGRRGRRRHPRDAAPGSSSWGRPRRSWCSTSAGSGSTR